MRSSQTPLRAVHACAHRIRSPNVPRRLMPMPTPMTMTMSMSIANGVFIYIRQLDRNGVRIGRVKAVATTMLTDCP